MATEFDSGAYCGTGGGIKALSGSDILTCIFSEDGSELLATEGEQEADLSLSADTSDTATKDIKGSWATNTPTTLSWEIDLDTVHIKSAQTNLLIRKAFIERSPLCMKQVYDDDDFTPICGGSCYVTSYEADSPSDDVDAISITLTGTGKLTYFDIDTAAAALATAKPSNRPSSDES